LLKDVISKDIKGLTIFMDNYYGQFKLGVKLNELGFNFIFTMRKNRLKELWSYVHGMMKSERTAAGKCITFNSAYNENFSITSWDDNGSNPTNFFTNMRSEIGDNLVKVDYGKEKQKEKIEPSVAAVYTKQGMHVVDTYNQHMSVNKKNVDIKSYSLRRLRFFTMIKILLINSWVYFKQVNKSNVIQRKYLENLATQVYQLKTNKS